MLFQVKMALSIKIHKAYRTVVAICDSDILGKKFEEGNKQLDLTSDFYNGEKRSDREIYDLMRNSYMLNLVGKKTIKFALDESMITDDNVRKIANIPYANVVLG